MRTDFITGLNDHLRTSVRHMREALALKQAEVARLESLIRVTENVASEEQMPGDPTVNGDREPLPAVARPVEGVVTSKTETASATFVNGRPVVGNASPAEQAA